LSTLESVHPTLFNIEKAIFMNLSIKSNSSIRFEWDTLDTTTTQVVETYHMTL
jgi:hypothetical protein